MDRKQDFPEEIRSYALYAYSTLKDGNMSFSRGDSSSALDNRKTFLWKMDVDFTRIVMPMQCHGDRIEKITIAHTGRGAKSVETAVPGTDAVITASHNLAMGVLTADCFPVFLVDAGTPAAGLVHAGWKSARQGICSKTVEAMHVQLGSDPRAIKALIGPGIRDCCYKVGEDFSAFFPRSARRRDGALFMDLAGENRAQLIEAGLSEENIFDTGVCTCCSDGGFFSHRKMGDSCGRMLSVLMLR